MMMMGSLLRALPSHVENPVGLRCPTAALALRMDNPFTAYASVLTDCVLEGAADSSLIALCGSWPAI